MISGWKEFYPVIIAATLGAGTPALEAAPEIRWAPDHSSVSVTGLDESDHLPASAGETDWAARFSVRAAGAEQAMLGKWSVEKGGTVRFTPRFPLTPGLTYEARWITAPGKQVTAKHSVPLPKNNPATVTGIDPGGATVPENLLKFYLHFSAPMSGRDVYRHIHLRTHAGKEVELPFLELAEELWNPEMTRLTLLIDPGRVKREVKPLEDIGPALVQGGEFTLSIDAAWPDASGQPLREPFVKRFKVTAPDRTPPNPAEWKITAPGAGSREPVRLRFSEPLDRALAQRLITVAGVSGTTGVSADGMEWTFTPASGWKSGAFSIVVQPELEDLAGNSVGKPFEVDIAGTAQEKQQPAAKPVTLPFRIP